MTTFSLTPIGTFPPPAPQDFPVGVQYQEDGIDLGDRAIDTVNLRRGLTATRGTAETANVLTIDSGAFRWVEYTASHLLVAADLGNGLKMNSASGTVITVPPDFDLDIAPGDGDVSVLLTQQGAGGVDVIAQSGVTVNRRSALSATLAGQYALVTLVHTGVNEWTLGGDLEAV